MKQTIHQSFVYVVMALVASLCLLADTAVARTTVSGEQDFKTSDYRLYQNANSLTPGTPLADVNDPGVLGTTGDSFRLRAGLKSEMGWKQLAPQSSATCGIALDDRVYCWGSNSAGYLGTSDYDEDGSFVPVAVDWTSILAGKTAKSIASAWNSTCILASDDLVYCWGWDPELGDGLDVQYFEPKALDTNGVLNGKTIQSLVGGSNHYCAIASDEEVYCWGGNFNGAYGDGTTESTSVPSKVDTAGVLNGKKANRISSASNNCMISDDGLLYCWGSGGWGSNGNGSTSRALSPVAVDMTGVLSGKTPVDLQTTSYGSCVIDQLGDAYCWGSQAILGNGQATNSSVPVAVDMSPLGGDTFTRFIQGPSWTVCAETISEDLYCWGYNYYGNLGDDSDSFDLFTVPRLISYSGPATGAVWYSRSMGEYNTCGVTVDGSGYCWGANWHGQIGDNTEEDRFRPTRIASTGPQITPSAETYTLQYAAKSAQTCTEQTTGFKQVTASSSIALHNNPSIADGDAITTETEDPLADPFVKPQHYVEDATFTNSSIIDPATYGMWDFSLKDSSAMSSTDYCIRIAYADGQPLERTTNVAQVTTAAGQVGAPTVSDVAWDSGKLSIRGTYNPVGTTKLQVVFNGKTYILGTDSELTTDENTWTLNLTSQAAMDSGHYDIEVQVTTNTGAVLGTDTTATLDAASQSDSGQLDETLANTGMNTTAVILLAGTLIATASLTFTKMNKRKGMTL